MKRADDQIEWVLVQNIFSSHKFVQSVITGKILPQDHTNKEILHGYVSIFYEIILHGYIYFTWNSKLT